MAFRIWKLSRRRQSRPTNRYRASSKAGSLLARAQYDWTVLDLGRNLNASTLSLLDLIDETYLVTSHEVPSLHQTKQMIQILLNSGYSQSSLRLVLNRTPRRAEVTLEELEKMLGLKSTPPSPTSSRIAGSLCGRAAAWSGIHSRQKLCPADR